MEAINKQFRRLFYNLGERIGEKPVFFIVSSIFVALFLGSGLLWFKYESDFQKMATTKGGPSEQERDTIDAIFPPGHPGSFDPSRRTQVGAFARIIIEASDGGTLFRKSVWNEIMQVDDLIHSASPEWRQNYSSLCGKWDGECFENKVLDLGEVMGQIENGSMRVSYPIMFNPKTFNAHVMPIFFGGVNLSGDGLSVESVKAVSLFYFLEAGTDVDIGHAWEQEVDTGIEYAKPYWKNINVFVRTIQAEHDEQLKGLVRPAPYFVISITLIVLFLGATTVSSDWVKAKPWAGILGVICTSLGTLAGCGLLSFIGVPFVGIATLIPFIMIAIGIDDTFVLLAAWRQTNPLDDVPKRLAHSYAEAGVSITITTLTDMLSFYVGVMTPSAAIQIFSTYAGTCVLFMYLFQIFLFGPCLANSGRQEAKNKHGFFWWKEATPKSKSDDKSKMFKLFMTGGIDKLDPTNIKNQSEDRTMLWFQTTFSSYLIKPWVQVLVLAVFIAYIGISSYGVSVMEQGFNLKYMYAEDSAIFIYCEKDEEYFQNYPYRVQVAITSPLDYFDKEVQHQVNEMILQMNATGHIALEYSENWLEDYTSYLNVYSDLYDLNVTDSQSFIDILRGNFLNGTSSPLREDVKFDEYFTQITASRFILQSKNGSTTMDLTNLVVALREIADNQTGFNVTVYNPFFPTTDATIIIEKLTVQLVSTAAGIVMLVAIFFIPSLACSFFVFVTMATTEFGVLGIMNLWGANLDMITLVGLIMSIGFAVNFTAHVSYAYITAEGSPEDRIRKAMYSLGLPILQGALSTIVGIFPVLFLPGYGYKAIAKVIILVMGFAGFHGLLVLPVLLLIIRPERFTCDSNTISGKSKGSYEL